MSDLTYEFKLEVKASEIDDLNHVNNINYLNWVQLAANKHWKELSNSKIDEKYVWVVLRHEIDYFQPAFINETILVKTWVGSSYGVKSERFVEIRRNDELLAKAKTIWCLLDKVLMKPVRIPSEILQILKVKEV
ncbi:acyl-CoA thioesterase [Lutibacter sp.]|uniref:acyl-CoA thioesterase n=1 Tax=Lutibacter sp. TaxID=1925666 RepID=UPI0035617C70